MPLDADGRGGGGRAGGRAALVWEPSAAELASRSRPARGQEYGLQRAFRPHERAAASERPVYWEVVFVKPGKSKGESLTGGHCFGVAAGSVTAAMYGDNDGIRDSKKWWGLEDGVYEAASGHKEYRG